MRHTALGPFFVLGAATSVIVHALPAAASEAAPASQPASRPAEDDASHPASADEDGASSRPASRPAGVATDRDDEQSSPSRVRARIQIDGDDVDEGEEADAEDAKDADEDEGFGAVIGIGEPIAREDITAADVTSRPGASSNAVLLPRGAGLVEMSVQSDTTLGTRQEVTAQSFTVPSLALRFGLFDSFEVRAAATYLMSVPLAVEGAVVDARVSALSLGSSVLLSSGAGFMPVTALHLDLGLPLQTLAIDDFSASARVASYETVFDIVTIGGNVAGAWDGSQDSFTLNYTAITAVSIGAGLGVYAEVYGDAAASNYPTPVDITGNVNTNLGPVPPPSVWVDGGLYYSVGKLVMLDAAAGVNALGSSGSWWVGVGVSVLFPGHLSAWMGDD